MEIPDSLARKIDLFAGRGRLFQSDYDLFAEPSWIAVLMGQGVIPRKYDALVDSLPEAALVQRLKRMLCLIGQTAQAMPGHEAFIARYCAAEAVTGVPARTDQAPAQGRHRGRRRGRLDDSGGAGPLLKDGHAR